MSSNGVIDSLLVSLGYDYDASGGDKFSDSLDNLQDKAAAFVAAIVGGSAAVYGLAAATSAGIDDQGKLAGSIGESIDNVDALAHSLSIVGEESGAVDQILVGLSSTISEASRGLGGGIEVFGRLGISVSESTGELKSALDVLLEVSDSFEDLDSNQQIELAKKLGLESAIKLLQSGSDGIRKLMADAKELGTATEEDAFISAEFQDSIVRMTRSAKYFSVILNREITPYLTDLTNKVVDWWRENKNIIEQDIGGYVEKIGDSIKFLTAAAIGFLAVGFTMKLLQLMMAMRKVSVAAMLMNAAIFAIPILISTLVAAIAGLAHEAKVFFSGGDTIFNDMIRSSPELEDRITAIAAVFATIYDTVGMIFTGWEKIIALFKSDTTWEEHLDNLKNMSLDAIGIGPLSDPYGEKGFFDNDVFKFFSNFLPSNQMQTIGGMVSMPSAPAQGKIVRNEYNVDVGGIEIVESNSPRATAEEVNRVLMQERAALETNQEG